MKRLSQYKIDLKGLSNQETSISYDLGQDFFDAIDSELVRKGNIKVDLTIRKTIGAFEFDITLLGKVQIPCDRCLDEMSQKIDAHNRLVVKLGSEYFEESDEVVIIPEDEGAINIAWYLFEFIALNIPIKHVHEYGKCNKTMMSKYRELQAVDISDDEDLIENLDDEDSILDNSSEEFIDPRWEALKKLKK